MPRFPRRSDPSGLSRRRLVSRRRVLSLVAALAAFALPALRYRVIADEDGDFVIVNGWVLRKDDLKRS